MAEEEKVYVSNATNPLKKVMMCSPRYYQFNGINVITAEWMKKGDQEKNDVTSPTGARRISHLHIPDITMH